ncbi:MAG: hypothetical protein A3G34_13455 [Candidatus Lindowbacteria bacterium RIFCSPLOWO2_12_FULL_62_27]|nr:MAG: hypothetical protein A3I06_10995 [Candidatus Lindowbacteria bacterium RIFCSPLOWO2_02_FULL_62_12]OGH62589.1 MAG: hypothetical protein A3G34_13455 [Candidatus Lindowbacteria bacterium RIFCSPLOWO2_12_FULL_62_27]
MNGTRERRPQKGFISLLALVILAFIISLASAYLTAGSKEINVAQLLLSGDQARLAALAGVRLTAGLLVQDVVSSSAVDHHGENWYLVTESTAGATVPYALDSVQGVYFHVLVVDLSGRPKANATNSAKSASLIDKVPNYDAAAANSCVNGDYWTISEYAFVGGLSDDRVTGVSPYGRDVAININTVDLKDDYSALDPPDIIGAMMKLVAGSTSTNAPTYSRKLLRCRRGGSGQDANAVYDDWTKDNNPTGVANNLGAWSAYATAFTSPTTNTAQRTQINWVAQNYGRLNSEGFFLIKSQGWVVKDPGAGSCPDPTVGCREAQYQVMRIIKRSATGYQDCANREWYFEKRDLPVPPYIVNSSYDYENSFFIYDSNF